MTESIHPQMFGYRVKLVVLYADHRNPAVIKEWFGMTGFPILVVARDVINTPYYL
jgi:hypothetical protein